jgi:O-antigen/teichoic acid export membrane protein
VTARGLIVVNILCAVLGLGQGIYVAGTIGAQDLAVVGVLVSSFSVVANFVDIRPIDLASKLFYEYEDPSFRAGVLRACIAINGLIAAATLILGTIVALFLARGVIERPVAGLVVGGQALVSSSAFLSGTPAALLRLTDRLALIAVWKIGAQLLTASCVTTAVWITGSLEGYYVGAAIAAALLVPISLVSSARAWRRIGVELRDRSSAGVVWARYRSEGRFLFGSSALGYSKMLHRGGDVIAMAAVSNDTVTGVYRLARSLTDGLYLIYEALYQVYFPRLLSLLARQEFAEYRREARRLVAGSVLFTAIAATGAAVVMPVLERHALSSSYPGLTMPVIILTLPFAAVVGLHLWLWAALVHLSRLGLLVGAAVIAAGLQLAGLVLLSRVFGDSALWGALTYLAYYGISYSVAIYRLHLQAPELLPVLERAP